MSKKRRSRDDTPAGGWLGPPPTEGIKALAVASGTNRKDEWRWKEIPQTRKDKELRKEWERRMAKADERGKTQFKWPPKEKDQ